VGEADRAMHLMRDLRHFAGGLAGADLGRGNGERGRGASCGHGSGRALDRHRRRGCLLGEQRQLLLDGLEFGDRPAKLHTVPLR